jgi:hypothetical protein
MKTKEKILALIYVGVTSITILVMLVTSFEQFHEKYLPSFLAAQKFVLPVIVSAMAVAYLFFFEPERLAQKKTLMIMRVVMIITLGLFSYYLTTIDVKLISVVVVTVFVLQWIMTVIVTLFFFR